MHRDFGDYFAFFVYKFVANSLLFIIEDFVYFSVKYNSTIIDERNVYECPC